MNSNLRWINNPSLFKPHTCTCRVFKPEFEFHNKCYLSCQEIMCPKLFVTSVLI